MNEFYLKDEFLLKSLFIFILIIIYYLEENDAILDYLYENNYKYFSCIANTAKFENRYAREFIEHYLSIGVEKFYLMDDNLINGEKLIDVLQDYVNKNIVEIIDNRGKKVSITEFYEYILKYVRYKCKWLLYYDFDEHLEFVDGNMTIKNYLSNHVFDKCDVVKIHWLMYYDNDLVRYDNRSLKERFKNSTLKTFENNFHKSIVRVRKYQDYMWTENTGPHQPNESLVNMCDSKGKLANVPHGILGHPNYKYCYLKHYSMKTAEEYALKLVRGEPKETKYTLKELNDKLERFFKYNKFSNEKLLLFEKKLNMTFPQYHNSKKIKPKTSN